MDNQRAQFILQSFRSDGADAHDPDFVVALPLAPEDRELGEWLARERGQDVAFAHALSDLKIPEDLRDAVLAMLESADGRRQACVSFTEQEEAFGNGFVV